LSNLPPIATKKYESGADHWTDFFMKPDGAAQAFMVAGALWFVVGALYGIISAISLTAPEFFNNIPWLVFGRTRPIHVNTVIYGFVTSMLIGCGLFYAPALLRTRLWSEPLGWLGFLFWQLTVLSGPLTFSAGMSRAASMPNTCGSSTFARVVHRGAAVDMLKTVGQREENTLYVSVWYFIGMFIWMCGVYPIGNVMWHPSTGAVPGLLDSVFLWFYGHNLPAYCSLRSPWEPHIT